VLTLRAARWPDDLALLADLDTSFTTDQVYHVIRDELSFRLVAERFDPPLHKEFGSILSADDRLPVMDCAVVAQLNENPVGFGAAEYEAWNRRMSVRHLYVAVSHRRHGIGSALLNQIDAAARAAGARCLWLDTSNSNYPAIQFYQRMGFRLCGLDQSFYDLEGPAQDEVALFFVRELVHHTVPPIGSL
jgi:ribosomal protein S18 acetylase RimI-like enzyme